MYILLALLSAICAAGTAFFSKIGMRQMDSRTATAIRTVVVLGFAWIIVGLTGAQQGISDISSKSWLFLIISGVATGASWLCYFAALKIGDVSRVAAVDKLSIVLTVLMSFLFLGEPAGGWKIPGVALICAGSVLMAARKAPAGKKTGSWLILAVLSAIFAAATSIFGKIGVENVDSNLALAIRTGVVLVFAWIVVFAFKKQSELRLLTRAGKKDLLFLILSGAATGGSWLFYYAALQAGPAGVVACMDKLSIVFTVLLSFFVLKEKISARGWTGLGMIAAGAVLTALPVL